MTIPAEDSEFGVADWRRLLRSLGEDPSRQGLIDTPNRVRRAWAHWTRGYQQDPAAILKTFSDGGESYDELIIIKKIPVYSHCEHHLAPFFGHATIGYLPRGRIVGLSKLTRLVHCFAARLQVQERLTQQVAQSLYDHLQPIRWGHYPLSPYVHGVEGHYRSWRRNAHFRNTWRSKNKRSSA